jgi:CubicO group peptidase (beta-lactamase class C family)
MSGLRYDEYLRREIFDPLQMVDTDFWVPADKVGRFAACYGRNSRKELVLVDDPTTSTYLRMPKLFNGGGGLVGTIGDYVRFCAMLANGGELDGQRILGRKTLELMTSNHLPGDGEMSDFALPSGYGEVGFTGTGFGLTVAVEKEPRATGVVGSAGSFSWGRGGLDHVLGRPGRTARRRLHDPAPPVRNVQLPRSAQGAGVRRCPLSPRSDLGLRARIGR